MKVSEMQEWDFRIKNKPLKPPDSVFHMYKVTSSVKHASCRQGPRLMDSKQ